MPEYSPIVELGSLDGINGFKLNGKRPLDGAGFAVSGVGDFNGDGFGDFIVGAWGADPNGVNSGASYVVFGTASGFGSNFNLASVDGNNGFKIFGVAADERSGFSVSSAGDVNGDGLDDLAIATRADGPLATYIVFGSGEGRSENFQLSTLDGQNGFKFGGASELATTAGDINGDGLDDVIVNADYVAYIIFGKSDGFAASIDAADLDGQNGFKVTADTGVGVYAVSAAGDVNGDGFDDLLLGAPLARYRYLNQFNLNYYGTVYVWYGKASGFSPEINPAFDGTDGVQIDAEGDGYTNTIGFNVSTAGDLNGDGFDDFVFNSRTTPQVYQGPTERLSTYIVFGSPDFLAVPSDLDGNNGFAIAGGDVAKAAGDVNGDGFDDIIVGLPRSFGLHGKASGMTFVVFGKASGFSAEFTSLDGNNGFQIFGKDQYDFSGQSVSGAGDLNGDGFDDLIVGAFGADGEREDSGAAYVIFGGPPGQAVTRIGTAIDNTIHGGNFNDELKGLDGDDTLIGLRGRDTLRGNDGNDTLAGGEGRDSLRGGDGTDAFIFGVASESTSKRHDTIVDGGFAGEDTLKTAVAVTGIDAQVTAGQLDNRAFDAKLASAADDTHLGAGHAVIFTPDTGRLAGHTYLIVDQNGVAGYQGGADLVIELTGETDLSGLGVEDFTT